jgi:predicted Zn-dependent peptidase
MTQNRTRYKLPDCFRSQERIDSLSGKRLLTFRHRCGLTLKVLDQPGFFRRFAAVTVPFGSVHTCLVRDGQRVAIPAGTAHFLEHCIFSRDDGGGLLGRLAELGASANAYTTHSHTLYHFTAAHHFAAALDCYLDAIFAPGLDEARVEAEKPIILAELDQYRDDPDSRSYMLLIESLYARHPVRLDIGGTAESVSAIRADTLQLAWRQCYHPSRVSLTLAGDIDLEPILASLAERFRDLPQAEAVPDEALLPDEPDLPIQSGQRLAMDVAAPIFLVGVKDPDLMPDRRLRGLDLTLRQRTARLVLDTLLSPVSPLYAAWYEEGLINDSFGFHYACEESFAFLTCGGESNHPEEAAARIQADLIAAMRLPLDPDVFEIQKRAAAGDIVRSLDSVEQSGMLQARCNLQKIDLFEYPAIYDKMTHETAAQTMAFLADPNRYVSVILTPLEVKNHAT